MDFRADWELSEQVIGAAIDIHRELGPGLVEGVYEECLCWKLGQDGIAYARQKPIPITFREMTFPGAFRLDVVVDRRLVVEIKSVDHIIALHKAQLMTYLKMTGLKTGLLINFNSAPLKDGIKRVEIG